MSLPKAISGCKSSCIGETLEHYALTGALQTIPREVVNFVEEKKKGDDNYVIWRIGVASCRHWRSGRIFSVA
ncbi:MAG: hypothetical protein A3C06_02595 [Candidatus Taylorbacteria bacterium RIFCSPHIGHO2_02_FULL_46_13]|uniref:Uncharacterized protein n=1 Tax=Candidatus Taylorbacteria bacterium RIFCSPHIGHO2_02_FULL_46_13 TaxID=1802312 RepID=A0A1G2MRS8_9BACT|nr:MAG: hypothetical protein A3C06_02595 [Candidatus Taylorbacteria bacterium RIFCSPHIGHO2_02_FULL_46_13]